MSVDWDQKILAPLINTFGEEATFLPAAGGAFPIIGVFDEAYREITFDTGGIPATTEMPVLGVRLAEMQVTPQQNDKVFLSRVNATYIVRDVRLDGHGWAKLMLNFVSSL